MSDIFVSYANEDREKVRPVVNALEKRGWSVFWDRNVSPGNNWENVVNSQLKEARCIVVLWSMRSIESHWVLFEAGVAKHRRVLVPGRLDEDVQIPSMFSGIQAANLLDPSGALSPDFEMLSSSVSQMLSRRRTILKLGVLGLVCMALLGSYLATARWRRLLIAADRIGLKQIEPGRYSTDEDDRLGNSIRRAKTIKLLAPNASTFVQAFKGELDEFFLQPESSMQVLFGTPASDFYREMTQMTFKKRWDESDKAYRSNMDLVEFSRKRLIDLAKDERKIQFEYFNTQYRMTFILVDDRYCFLTMRLPPDEGQESPRFEFDGGYSKKCKDHFDRLWQLRKAGSENKTP